MRRVATIIRRLRPRSYTSRHAGSGAQHGDPRVSRRAAGVATGGRLGTPPSSPAGPCWTGRRHRLRSYRGGADGPAGSVTTGMGVGRWRRQLHRELGKQRVLAPAGGQHRASVVEDRERDPPAVEVMHPPARLDTSDNVPSWRGSGSCAGVPIIRPASVPVRPAVGSDVHTGGMRWLPARCSSSVTTADGLACLRGWVPTRRAAAP